MMADPVVVDLMGKPIKLGAIVAVAALNCKRAVLRKGEVVSIVVKQPNPDGLARMKMDPQSRRLVKTGEVDESFRALRRAWVGVKTWGGTRRGTTELQGDNSIEPTRNEDGSWTQNYKAEVQVNGIVVL